MVRLCMGRMSVYVLLRCNIGNWGNESLLQIKDQKIKINKYMFDGVKKLEEITYSISKKPQHLHSQTSVHFLDSAVFRRVPILIVRHPRLGVEPPGVGRCAVQISAIASKSEGGLSLWPEGLGG